MGTCRGKDAKHRVSTGKIIPTIGKCFCIMGGRMPFAPKIIRDLKHGSGYIIGLHQIAFGFVENKAYLMNGHALPVPVFFRIILLDYLLKGLIISLKYVVHHFYFHHINMMTKDNGYISLTMIVAVFRDNLYQ